MNIINHNNKNNLSNKINISKIIPNNFRHKYKNIQINSLESNKNINTNPNHITEYKIKGLKIKNNKKFNFPIKNILFEQKKKKNQNLKTNIILKDKDKINNIGNNTPKYPGEIQNKDNNTNALNKILYSKSLSNEKRSNSEYFLNPIKRENYSPKSNNNSISYKVKKLRGYSLENLGINKFEIENKKTTRIKKRKEKIKNRAINVFNDNESGKEMPVHNRNMSFTFANKNAIDNNLLEIENVNNNDKRIFDNDIYLRILKKKIIS